jgi:hypothetical protein
VVDGAASMATAAWLAASPSAASARDGSRTGLRAAFANGAEPSVAARMRASLEGELGAKMPRVLDRPEPATKSPSSSFTLPELSRVVPTIPSPSKARATASVAGFMASNRRTLEQRAYDWKCWPLASFKTGASRLNVTFYSAGTTELFPPVCVKTMAVTFVPSRDVCLLVGLRLCDRLDFTKLAAALGVDQRNLKRWIAPPPLEQRAGHLAR